MKVVDQMIVSTKMNKVIMPGLPLRRRGNEGEAITEKPRPIQILQENRIPIIIGTDPNRIVVQFIQN